jgi:hypothetical protein
MVTAGGIPRPRKRATPDETAPFPLQFVVVDSTGARSQDETAPFPLRIAAYPRRVSSSLALSTLASSRRAAPGVASPAPAQRSFEASSELLRYAERIAAGEKLPPFQGPILASEPAAAVQRDVPASVYTSGPGVEAGTVAGRAPAVSPLKGGLGVLLLVSALVASATAGDDAALRAAGLAISRWLNGGVSSHESLVPSAQAPCIIAAPVQAR